MPVYEFLQDLKANQNCRKRIAHIETFPQKEAEFKRLSQPLPEDLESYLNRKGMRLYTHQSAAIDLLREGENIILTTPTASGKSLAFNLPVFERLHFQPDATALYLYPTKALANDQLKGIREIEGYTGIRSHAAIYDGDTPNHRRYAIRESARVILSNPYELHHVLPWHYKWSRLYGNLQFVVIDEAHRYRGIFGSHFAFLLRRLLRIARLYGSEPQFIFSTATIANAGEFAHRLCGKRCTVIEEDGSPAGEKHFILYNPFFDGSFTRSTHQDTSELFVNCVNHGLQTLCFTVSRKMAELITLWSRKTLVQEGIMPANSIIPYRAGYLPETRREIEHNLKEGVVNGVVSTNALEVGIDVGTLDAVIISGYPGTMMATWQQAGRAGRRQETSFAALVAFQNPLDQYFMRHPNSFLSKPHEHAIIDLENPYIMAGHLLCAAAEAPLTATDGKRLFGDSYNELVMSFAKRGLLTKNRQGWIYSGRSRAVDITSLNSISTDTFRVLCKGRVIETMERGQAFREAYPGAVLLHQGETYIVEDMDLQTKRIRVRGEDVDFFTEVMKSVDTTIILERDRRTTGDINIMYGDVEVAECYHGYRIKRFDTVIGTEKLDLPRIRFTTRAIWFTIPAATTVEIQRKNLDLAGGLHGAEHAIIAMMPFHVMCDRWDIGGFSTPRHPDTDAPTILIYDGYEGGIGLAEKAFSLLTEIITTSYELVRDCGCSDGCPGCILSPKCGNDNRPLDKEATGTLLDKLSTSLMRGAGEEQDDDRTLCPRSDFLKGEEL